MIRWANCSQFSVSIERNIVNPTLHFFIGKGGVGKSTTSALSALHHAGQAVDTLLVSMDPAHNQRDIFCKNFSEKPLKVTRHLTVKEVDTDYWIAKYLKDTENQIKRAYQYHTAFNLQGCFNVLRFSPGLEEYALLLAFENILHAWTNKEIIIFDMPPTALTLKFFSLPFTTLIWLEELLRLRKMIYSKKEIISKIKLGTKTIEQDKVLKKLEQLIRTHSHVRDHFISPATRINLVMNNDRLSSAEALRIKKRLTDIGIPVWQLVINKITDEEKDACPLNELGVGNVIRFPLSDIGLCGADILKDYLQKYSRIFSPG
jgi:arsenite-transporting ATPase